MRYFSAITPIFAPPVRVWAVLSQVTQWPDWTPTVESVTPVDGQRGAAPAVRRSYRVVQPKLRPATYTITSLEPGKEFTWGARQVRPLVRRIACGYLEQEARSLTVLEESLDE